MTKTFIQSLDSGRLFTLQRRAQRWARAAIIAGAILIIGGLWIDWRYIPVALLAFLMTMVEGSLVLAASEEITRRAPHFDVANRLADAIRFVDTLDLTDDQRAEWVKTRATCVDANNEYVKAGSIS